ncbi:zinc metalloprotease [Actinocorallia longicatena]
MLTFSAAAALAYPPAAAPATARRVTTAGCVESETARLTRPRDTHRPGPDVVRMDRELNQRLARLRIAIPAQIEVPVRFHVLSSGKRGRVSRAQVDRQISTLNAAYGGSGGGADTGVRFVLVSTDYSDNDRWFNAPADNEIAIKSHLHQGGREVLNLYSAAVGGDVLGFSTFPELQRDEPDLDGVVIDYRTMPGGTYPHYNLGYTAVHEIGHWLGVFHTFENGCRSPGDAVADTPPEEEATDGCPSGKDTCPGAGTDPVHNFMDYSFDACMREFTPGQGARIRKVWAVYRAPSET